MPSYILGSLFERFIWKLYCSVNFLLLASAGSDPRGQSQEGTQDPITLAKQANH